MRTQPTPRRSRTARAYGLLAVFVTIIGAVALTPGAALAHSETLSGTLAVGQLWTADNQTHAVSTGSYLHFDPTLLPLMDDGQHYLALRGRNIQSGALVPGQESWVDQYNDKIFADFVYGMIIRPEACCWAGGIQSRNYSGTWWH